MTSIFTVLILYAFFFFILFAISKVAGSKLWTIKMIRWVVLGYVALGLVAMIILNFTTKVEERTSGETMQEIFEADQHVWNALRRGQDISRYEEYIKEEWQFELSSDQLTLTAYIENFDVAVVIERRDDPTSNLIYAKTYVIPYQYRGIDFTDKANIDYFEFEKDELFVKEIPDQEFRFYQLIPRMEILAQFKEDFIEDNLYYSFTTGRTILFLNVPSHVNIKDESGFINFVD